MSRRPSTISTTRRGSSLGLIPEDQPPVTYEQSSGRTYVVQHLRGNAVVVRRTSSGGISDGRPGLASQPWDRRASLSPSTFSQPSNSSDWSSAAQTMPLRRASTQMSPLQMLPPPTSLTNTNMAGSSPSPSTFGRRQSTSILSGSFAGSPVAQSIHEEEDVDMMDVDVASPCSSAFSTPNSSPPSSPGVAPSMSYTRQSPKSPLRSKMASWLRHV